MNVNTSATTASLAIVESIVANVARGGIKEIRLGHTNCGEEGVATGVGGGGETGLPSSARKIFLAEKLVCKVHIQPYIEIVTRDEHVSRPRNIFYSLYMKCS